MTSKTVLNGLKPLHVWHVWCAKCAPRRWLPRGLSLVPVAIRVCWYKPSKVPT